MNEQPSMVFHLPYEIEDNPTGAGGIRPHRMRKAFSDLGYEVVDLSGTKPQRKEKFKKLKQRLSTGWRPQFMYAENSTMPNLLATSLKEGIDPFLEYSIMRSLFKAGVPIGMFYRDAYWKYKDSLPKDLYGKISVPLNVLDMIGYRRNKLHFFLPSLPMAEILELEPPLTWSALPPAGDPDNVKPLPDGELKLFYVGGLATHYKLDEFVLALKDVGNVELNLVCRKPEWDAEVKKNSDFLIPQIHVQHLNSYELGPVYEESHVCVLAVAPSDYRKFAVPFKLFEYISNGRPIIVTAGTEAARIVESLDAGWVVQYSRDDFSRLLGHLRNNPDEVKDKARNARKAALTNTWTDRAKTVVETLTN